jgi:hypothetical protein
MHKQFKNSEEIAAALNMKPGAVRQMLSLLNKDFRKRLEADIDAVKFDQIARLEHIAKEAFDAWERSKETSKIIRQKKLLANGQSSSVTEQTNEMRDQDGDPRYLKTAMEALADIRKIIGADSALKLQHSGDSKADAIKLDYPTTKQQFLEELASLIKQGTTDSVSEQI